MSVKIPKGYNYQEIVKFNSSTTFRHIINGHIEFYHSKSTKTENLNNTRLTTTNCQALLTISVR